MPSLIDALLGLAIGFVGGVLSGMFGIGGGIVTTPLMRLLLGVSPVHAIATTLVGIIPSAITGSAHYLRAGMSNWRIALAVGLAGATTSSLGALAVTEVGGTVAMFLMGAMIFYAAADTIHAYLTDKGSQKAGDQADETGAPDEPAPMLVPARADYLKSVVTGTGVGFVSGFLGVGGGFLIVPLLRRWVGLTHRQAVATSLLAVAILSIPGAITHALIGNTDWILAATLALGVVPGASLGAKLMIQSSERTAKLAFAVLMVVLGVWLVVNEYITAI